MYTIQLNTFNDNKISVTPTCLIHQLKVVTFYLHMFQPITQYYYIRYVYALTTVSCFKTTVLKFALSCAATETPTSFGSKMNTLQSHRAQL
ncbi:hypothetical protein PUN28_001210 [Cardiocondyla obscurior]|uniref:Uncharacterized protein n=1 Tax=Cardiocondyla obscurior TaxID=286306 RepID=A0AAW2H3X4_9HYME